jgi:hypothetical protein
MHLVWIIIRFLLGFLSGGSGAAGREPAWQPWESFLAVRAGTRRARFPAAVWMNVRPVSRRLGRPPDGHRALAATVPGGWGRWLVRRPWVPPALFSVFSTSAVCGPF